MWEGFSFPSGLNESRRKYIGIIGTREPVPIDKGMTRAGAQRTAEQTSDVNSAPAETLDETKWLSLCTAFVSLLVKSVALRQ